MTQHPKVTVGWTMACLEHALGQLGNTPAERRVRRQFHQLVLALERDGHLFPYQQLAVRPTAIGRVLPMGLARRPS